MTGYKRGDVVLVPFPFSSQTGIKKRPAVIVSSDSYNRFSSDVVIMAVTSKQEKTLKSGEVCFRRLETRGLIKALRHKTGTRYGRANAGIEKIRQAFRKRPSRVENALCKLLDLKKK